MVMARLHMICGNCGCNDMFEHKIHKDFNDYGDGVFTDEVVIACRNCSTLHSLSDNSELQEEPPEESE